MHRKRGHERKILIVTHIHSVKQNNDSENFKTSSNYQATNKRAVHFVLLFFCFVSYDELNNSQ